MNKIKISWITDEDREKAKQELEDKVEYAKEYMQRIKGWYWTKVAAFQIKYNGRDWKVVDNYDLGYGNYEKCELCGFPNCRYKFVIASSSQILDDATGNSEPAEKLSIGNCCVINYAQVPPHSDEAKALKRVKEQMIKVAKLNTNMDDILTLKALEMKGKEYGGPAYVFNKLYSKLLHGGDITSKEAEIINMLFSTPESMNKIKMTDEQMDEIRNFRMKLHIGNYNTQVKSLVLGLLYASYYKDGYQYLLTILENKEKIMKLLER